MRIPRIFHPAELVVGAQALLDDNATNHVARVLRLRAGAPLILFNGKGGEYEAVLQLADRKRVEVEVVAHHPREVESPLDITLVQSVSRGERMDYTIQKAVELGVSRVVPVFSARSVVALSGERSDKRQRHWEKIAAAACEQCGRNRVPEVSVALPLAEWLRQPADGLKLVLDPLADAGIHDLAPVGSMTLLIGPEGGLDAREIDLARDAGYQGLRLGPRVLRTETAAVVALAALQAQFGDL